jgi:hypothetical protein
MRLARVGSSPTGHDGDMRPRRLCLVIAGRRLPLLGILDTVLISAILLSAVLVLAQVIGSIIRHVRSPYEMIWPEGYYLYHALQLW